MIFSDRFLKNAIMLYIYIPMIIFVFGWTNIFVALLCLGVFGFVFYSFNKKEIKDRKIYISKSTVIISIIIIAIICYSAGIGRFVDQGYDWIKHNSVLNDLTNKSWPVYYNNKGEKSMLTYYIGQYIFPSFIGKIFKSFRLSEIINYVWCVFGIFLVFVQITSLLNVNKKIKQYLTLFILLFFNTGIIATVIRRIAFSKDFVTSSLWAFLGHGIKLDLRNNYYDLFLLFSQTIVIWMITLLFIEYKNNLSLYAIILLPCLLYGTICLIGFIPLAIVMIIYEIKKDYKSGLKGLFHYNNILMTMTWGIMLFLYLYGNVLGEKPKSIGFRFVSYGKWWPVYFIFIIANVIVLYLLILKDNKRNYLLVAAVIEICLIFLFQLGKYNDLHNATRPAKFILMFYTIKFINDRTIKTWRRERVVSKVAFILLMAVLVTGCYYPIHSVIYRIQNDKIATLGRLDNNNSLEINANRSNYNKKRRTKEDLVFNYYSYDLEKNYFYRYISREKYK